MGDRHHDPLRVDFDRQIKVVAHAKYLTLQLAGVAVPKKLFAAILKRIEGLRLAGASG